jgi:hypothetical protein
MLKLVLYSLLLFFLTPLSFSQESLAYTDGNALLDECDSGTSQQKTLCMGYIMGVMDSQVTMMHSLKATIHSLKPTSDTYAMPDLYCLPKAGIEAGQAVRITTKWLRDHPEKLHL